MVSTAPPHRLAPFLRSAAAAILWTSLALALTRGTLLFGMDRVAHESDLVRTWLRLAANLPEVVFRAGLCGLACGLGLASSWLLARGPLRLGVQVLLLGAAALLQRRFLAGWDTGDASREVGLDTDLGRQVALALLGLAFLIAAATLAGARLAERRAWRMRWSLVPLALLIAIPAGFKARFSSIGENMAVQKTIYDVLTTPGAWSPVAERPDAPALVDSICPSVDYRIQGADMPSLVLSPPGEVRFRAPEGLGALVLDTRAGIHYLLVQPESPWLGKGSVRFEVLVEGKGRDRIDIPLTPGDGRFPGTEWIPVGGPSGLWVGAGDEVRLRTTFLDEDGRESEPPEALKVGFGGLSFEKRWITRRTESSVERPNVILIVMDTLRADRMDVYGYDRPTTPHLAELGKRGTVYERAYSSASWTWPSTASILTGKLPQEHGVQDERSAFLSGLHTTVAEALQEEGMTTAAFSANVLIVPDKNFDQGFEFFDHGSGGTRPSTVVMPAALEWIEATAPTRFFLYLHLADPHAPLDPLPEGRALFAPEVPLEFSNRLINEHQHRLLEGCGHTEDGRQVLDECVPEQERHWVSDMYDACVWSGDHQVGKLLETLERLGIADETVIAFTSDHGEELYQHGFATHGHGLHEELVHVPLILAGPGVPEGRRSDEPVANRHLAPTLARLAGAGFEGAADPRDLARPESLGELRTEILFSTTAGWWNGRHRTPLLGMRDGDLSLLYAPEGRPWGAPEEARGEGDWQLYDLGADPGQEHDLALQRVDDARRLREALEARIEELRARKPATLTLEAGEATLERLRAIGYIDD